MEHIIEVKGKSLGRVASQAAKLLMGKDRADFVKNKVSTNTVVIKGASKLRIDPKKLEMKEYSSYSGYPGGLKKTKMSKVIEEKGYQEIVKRAIYGMLPANKLRKDMMKNLTVEA